MEGAVLHELSYISKHTVYEPEACISQTSIYWRTTVDAISRLFPDFDYVSFTGEDSSRSWKNTVTLSEIKTPCFFYIKLTENEHHDSNLTGNVITYFIITYPCKTDWRDSEQMEYRVAHQWRRIRCCTGRRCLASVLKVLSPKTLTLTSQKLVWTVAPVINNNKQ